MSAPLPPSENHPWRNPKPASSLERARQLSEGTRALRLALASGRGGAENLQGFRVTHVLLYEGELLGRLYRYRGVYYTLEQWSNGELGLRKDDLREGERLAKV